MLFLAFRPFGIQPSLTLQPDLLPFPATHSMLQAPWWRGSSLYFSLPLCFGACCSLSLQSLSSSFMEKTPAHTVHPPFVGSLPHVTPAEGLSPACHPTTSRHNTHHVVLAFFPWPPPPTRKYISHQNPIPTITHTLDARVSETLFSLATCYAH